MKKKCKILFSYFLILCMIFSMPIKLSFIAKADVPSVQQRVLICYGGNGVGDYQYTTANGAKDTMSEIQYDGGYLSVDLEYGFKCLDTVDLHQYSVVFIWIPDISLMPYKDKLKDFVDYGGNLVFGGENNSAEKWRISNSYLTEIATALGARYEFKSDNLAKGGEVMNVNYDCRLGRNTEDFGLPDKLNCAAATSLGTDNPDVVVVASYGEYPIIMDFPCGNGYITASGDVNTFFFANDDAEAKRSKKALFFNIVDRSVENIIKVNYPHQWELYAAGNEISAICVGEDTDECEYHDDYVKFTITTEDREYTSEPYSGASIYDELTSVVKIKLSVGDISYEGTGQTEYAKSTTAPTIVGTYKATVCVTYDGNDYIVEDEFEIKKATAIITALDQSIVKDDNITSTVADVIVSGTKGNDALNEIVLTPSTLNVTSNGKITPSSALIRNGIEDRTSNYKIEYVEGKLVVAIRQVSLIVKPTATPIIYGQSLEDSNLMGGETDIEGEFVWKIPQTKPTVADSNKVDYIVQFVPNDTDNYLGFECTIKVEVLPKSLQGEDIQARVEVDKYNNLSIFVSDNDKELFEDVDYKCDKELKNHVFIVTITGIGNYKDSIVKEIDEKLWTGNIVTAVVKDESLNAIEIVADETLKEDAKNVLKYIIANDENIEGDLRADVQEALEVGIGANYDAMLCLKLKDITDSVNQNEKNILQDFMNVEYSEYSNATAGLYLDISLYLNYVFSKDSGNTVMASGTENIKDISDEALGVGNGFAQYITIKIPKNLRCDKNHIRKDYKIVRIHKVVEGEAEDYEVEELEIEKDGQDIRFLTDKFSTYALVYEDEILPKSITLDKKKISFTNKNKEEVITAVVLPNEATDKEVVWTSSDESVATVDQNGKVMPKKNGICVIKATVVRNGLSDTCKISVNIPEKSIVSDEVLSTGDTTMTNMLIVLLLAMAAITIWSVMIKRNKEII